MRVQSVVWSSGIGYMCLVGIHVWSYQVAFVADMLFVVPVAPIILYGTAFTT